MNNPMDLPVAPRLILRRKLLRYSRLIGGLLLVLVVLGIVLNQLRPGTVSRSQIEVATAARGTLQRSATANGKIEATERVAITSPVGGKVERVIHRAGARVMKNALLAILRNPQRELEVLARRSEVTQQMSNLYNIELTYEQRWLDYVAQLHRVEAAADAARRLLERTERLREQGMVSAAALEDAQRNLKLYTADLVATRESMARFETNRAAQKAELRNSLTRLHEGLRLAEEGLKDLRLTAPISGTLSSFDLQVGQHLAAGAVAGHVHTGNYKLVAAVDQYYLGQVVVGQSAVANQGRALVPMRVSRIAPMVANGTFEVELEAEKLLDGVTIGQVLPVSIFIAAPTQAVTIPNGPYLTETDGRWLFVIDDHNQVRRQDVMLGQRTQREVEVTSGLREGERIIVSSYKELLHHDALRIAD